MESDNNDSLDLYLQPPVRPADPRARVLAVGEILWDLFPNGARIGGAPLNFAVHLTRLRQSARVLSAIGRDARGIETKRAMRELGIDARLVQSTPRFETGCARVETRADGHAAFTIERPAAYDAVELSPALLSEMVAWNPQWLYYGTLFAACPQPRAVLQELLRMLPNAARFYDANLRPGFDERDLVGDLLRSAHVVKLNEQELRFVHEFLDLPSEPEEFCRVGTDRYRWRAACVTLGDRGCAMRVGNEYIQAQACPVKVADTVGAGDAFAAAFLHGLISQWPVARIAAFANRVGAFVAGTHGAIPDQIPDAILNA